MKRIISVVLLVFMICACFPLAAFAEESNNARNSNYFASYGINLARQSDGRIKIVFSASGNGLCSEIGVASYEIEEKGSDGSWDDYSGQLSGRTGTNVQNYNFSKYFTPRSGKRYRVKCTFFCSLDGGSEFKSYTSGSILAS